MEQETRQHCDALEQQAQDAAKQQLSEVQQRGADLEEGARMRSEQLMELVRQDADRNWADVNQRLDQLCEDNAELRRQLSEGAKKRKWYQ